MIVLLTWKNDAARGEKQPLSMGAAASGRGTPVFTMLGLGIYLPGYLTLTAVLGGVIRFILDKAAPKFSNARGGIIAAGLLAGEGFLGVIIALGTAISIIKGM